MRFFKDRKPWKGQEKARDPLVDIGNAVSAVQKRSEGLIYFVYNYRTLTRVPRPEFQVFPVSTLLDQVTSLMKPNLAETGIELMSQFHGSLWN